jgi:hypothetical protein
MSGDVGLIFVFVTALVVGSHFIGFFWTVGILGVILWFMRRNAPRDMNEESRKYSEFFAELARERVVARTELEHASGSTHRTLPRVPVGTDERRGLGRIGLQRTAYLSLEGRQGHIA